MENSNNTTNKTGDEIVCPNCGSHQVRWVPYPKIEFGSMFILWLVISLVTVKGTIIVFAVGLVYWSIALVIRLRQNRRANLVNRMNCDICGVNFEVDKNMFHKGGREL